MITFLTILSFILFVGALSYITSISSLPKALYELFTIVKQSERKSKIVLSLAYIISGFTLASILFGLDEHLQNCVDDCKMYKFRYFGYFFATGLLILFILPFVDLEMKPKIRRLLTFSFTLVSLLMTILYGHIYLLIVMTIMTAGVAYATDTLKNNYRFWIELAIILAFYLSIISNFKFLVI